MTRDEALKRLSASAFRRRAAAGSVLFAGSVSMRPSIAKRPPPRNAVLISRAR